MSWLTDGIAAVQSMKSTKTYGEWIENLIRLITPTKDEECLLVGMVNFTYQELSTKNKKNPTAERRRLHKNSHRRI